MAIGPFYQSKSAVAKSRREKEIRDAEAHERRAKMEEDIQRRVAMELWRLERLAEEELR